MAVSWRRASGWSRMKINKNRLVETASALIDVHSFTGDEQRDGRADGRRSTSELGLQVQWQQVEDGRANALGTWRGTGGGKTLMFNGHMDTSYSGREPWLKDVPGFQPKAFVTRRAALRARHLEHEGRARLLRRGRARAAGRRRAAARRRADRRRLRRDREDAVRRGAGRAVPRLRRRLALPRLARRRRRHVPARRADRGQGRARPLRRALAAHPRARQLHPHRVQRGQARPELDPAHARGDGRGARVDPDLGGRSLERLPRREGDRQHRRRRGRLRLARLAHAAPHRSVPRRARAADEGDGRRAARGARLRALARGALPRLRDRGRGLRDGARARRSTRGTSSSPAIDAVARGGLRRDARAATSRAGSATPRR